MTRFILHVGPHKTGTTYIQSHFRKYRPQLRELGIDYPDEWCVPGVDHCHFGLFRQLRARQWDELSADMRRVRERGLETVVVSAEDLSSLTEEELAFLRENLDGEVSVVFYIRRWADIMPSSVQENIRQGSMLTLPELLLPHMLHPLTSAHINYAIRLDRYAQVFGEAAVLPVVYDNVIEDGQNLFAHFLRNIVRCDADLPVDGAVVHGSQPAEEIELLRMGNVLRAQGLPVTPRWGEFMAGLRKRDTTEIRALMRKHAATVTINEMSEPFTTVYRDVLARYRDRIVEGSRSANAARLFRRVRKDMAYIHPNYLADPAAPALLRQACGIG